jgi:hypothetical protein
MPAFRKMSPAEIAVFDQPPIGPRAQVAQEYDAYLADFAVDDYGRAELIDGERRAVVRQRLQAAARSRAALPFRPWPTDISRHPGTGDQRNVALGDCRSHPGRRSHGRFTTAATTPATPSTPDRSRALS